MTMAPSGQSGTTERRSPSTPWATVPSGPCVSAGTADLLVRQVRDEHIHQHLGLARTIAGRYIGRGIDTEDLHQVASLALVLAADRFDPDHGTSFAGYAAVCIHGELKRHLRDHAWAVRPPRPVHDIYQHVIHATEELTHILGAIPTTADIANYLNIDLDRVREAQNAHLVYTAISLDALLEDQPGHLPHQLRHAVHTNIHDNIDLALTIDHALSQLLPRDQRIARMRFMDNLTQKEIGEHLGVSQMQVSRLISALTARLRIDLTHAA